MTLGMPGGSEGAGEGGATVSEERLCRESGVVITVLRNYIGMLLASVSACFAAHAPQAAVDLSTGRASCAPAVVARLCAECFPARQVPASPKSSSDQAGSALSSDRRTPQRRIRSALCSDRPGARGCRRAAHVRVVPCGLEDRLSAVSTRNLSDNAEKSHHKQTEEQLACGLTTSPRPTDSARSTSCDPATTSNLSEKGLEITSKAEQSSTRVGVYV